MNNNYEFDTQTTELTVYKPKRRKRKTLTLKIFALMMVCMLLGTAGGVLGMHFYLQFSSVTVDASPAEDLTPVVIDNIIPEADIDPVIGNLTSKQLKKLSLQEVFAHSDPAVVAIATEIIGRNAFGQTVNLPSAGSGFVISSDGYIVTNNHVIDGASTIKVQMSDGKSYDAKVVGADSYTDLAVLKIEATGLKHLTFGDSDSLLVGDQVSAIGNPLGQFANTFTVGNVSALQREINVDGIPRTMLQTDAAVNSGNSGGPLINEYGLVVGVVTAKSQGSGVEGLGFAIPSNLAGDIVRQLIDHGYVTGRPYLGVGVQTQFYNYSGPMLEISSVEPDSGADKAGIRVGDYILEVDGVMTATREALLGVLYKYNAGDTIKVRIQRGQQAMTFDVTLGEIK